MYQKGKSSSIKWCILLAILLLTGCGLFGPQETDESTDSGETPVESTESDNSSSGETDETAGETESSESESVEADFEIVESEDDKFGSAPSFSLGSLPTLAELIEKYPAIADLLNNPDLTDPDSVRSIYDQMIAIYKGDGVDGLNVFLKDTGLAAQFGLDSSYVDYLMVYEDEGADAAESLARERGLITEDNQLRMVIIFESGASVQDIQGLLEQNNIVVLEDAGEEVEVGVPISALKAAQSSDVIMGQLLSITQHESVSGIRTPRTLTSNQYNTGAIGQGVQNSGADEWHAAGITGEGVKVAVIDLGFSGFLDLVGGDLPDNNKIFVYNENDARALNAEREVHGTATAEIVHDMAPGAEIYIVKPKNDLDYLDIADWLVANDIKIVSHSVGSLTEPIDGTGFLDGIIDDYKDDFVWINSSGNYAEAHLDMVFEETEGLHTFPNGETVLPIVIPGPTLVTIALQWEGNGSAITGGEDHDYDLFLLAENAAGTELEIVETSRDPQFGNRRDIPSEMIRYVSDKEQVMYVAIVNSGAKTAKRLNLIGANTQFQFTMPEGSITSPSDARNAVAVGATYWADDSLEPYSSQGPTWDGRTKPEISAPARVDSVAYGSIFPGTSASAPHVAGAAALLLEANPNLSMDELRNMLVGSAEDLGSLGLDNEFGNGRVEMGAAPASAVAAVPAPTDPPVVAEPAATEPPVAEPTATEPPVAEPTATEPPVAEPTATEPPVAEPTATEPPVAEPTATEPPALDPTATPLPAPTNTPAPQPTAAESSSPVTGSLDKSYYTDDLEIQAIPEIDAVVNLPKSFNTLIFDEEVNPYVYSESTDGTSASIFIVKSIQTDGDLMAVYERFKENRESEGYTIGPAEPFKRGNSLGDQIDLVTTVSGVIDGVEVTGKAAIILSWDDQSVGIVEILTAQDAWNPAGDRLFELVTGSVIFSDL